MGLVQIYICRSSQTTTTIYVLDDTKLKVYVKLLIISDLHSNFDWKTSYNIQYLPYPQWIRYVLALPLRPNSRLIQNTCVQSNELWDRNCCLCIKEESIAKKYTSVRDERIHINVQTEDPQA